MQRLPPKPTLVILTVGFLALAPRAIPALQPYRVFDWEMANAVVEFRPRKDPSATADDWKRPFHPDAPGAHLRGGWKNGVYELDETGGALNHFYESLSRTEGGLSGALTRIVHYGDSPTTADMITGDAREALQNKYGDAGKGFCLIAKPWAWYDHRGIDMDGKGWRIDPSTASHIRDGLFGLGGVSFLSDGGASSRFKWKGTGPSSVEVAFLKLPSGGGFTVSSGDTLLGEVKTAAAESAPGFETFDISPEARDLELRATGGPVRLFGVTFDRPGPGVSYDSIGLNGAYVTILARFFNEAHWASELQHRKPDLVIVNYGTNESAYTTYVDKQYGKELKEIVRRLRAALPDSSILLMSPMDRGARQPGGIIGTMPNIPRIVAMQQTVANADGCAFFNTYEAMGGDGTMGRWYEGEPRLVGADFIHPMPAGAKIVGNLLYQALLDGYHRYQVRQAQELMRKKLAAATKP